MSHRFSGINEKENLEGIEDVFWGKSILLRKLVGVFL